MLTAQDEILLRDYKKAFREYYHSGKIVNVDEKLTVRLTYSVLRMEDTLPDLEYKAPPHRVSDYRILYLKKGRGRARIGTIDVELKDRTLFLVPARAVASSWFEHRLTGYLLSFNLEFFWKPDFPSFHLLKLNLFDAAIVPYAYLKNRDGEHIEQIFENLLSEHHHNRKNKEELIALKILQLIVLTDRFFDLGKQLNQPATSPVVVTYLTLVQEHFKEQHTVKFYAEKLHIHPNSLNAISKRYTGKSAKNIIEAMLITEAKFMLYHTNSSMKQIAYELGFPSPSQFFRFFKRETGVSPAFYRETFVSETL